VPEAFDRLSGSAAVAVILLFLSGCASQAPPSGGPPDKTPPSVLSTFPRSDSVGVAADTRIEITFSEPMNRRTVEQAVFLSPRLGQDPSYKWKGRRLRLESDALLASDRTYTVTVGAESRDAYRNKMLTSHTFTFSTGDALHDGEVTGNVRGVAGRAVYVQAFPLGNEDTPPLPTDRAPYVTQAGEHGEFRFAGLADGGYRVFAFEDLDADQAYDGGIERLAIPSVDAWVERKHRSATLPDLRLAVRDSVPPRVLAIRTIDSQKLRVKLDEPVLLPIDVRVAGDRLSIVSQYHAATDSSVVFLVTTEQVEGVEYSVHLTASDSRGNTAAQDTVLSAKGDGRVDTGAPSLVETDPADNEVIASGRSFVLTFDEAMSDVFPESLWDLTDSTSAPLGSWSWTAPNRLLFEPESPLETGLTRLVIQANKLADLSGNAVAEPTILSVDVISERDMGTVVGRVRPDSSSIVMTLALMNDRLTWDVRIAPGDSVFAAADLRPGQYVVSGFYDSDGNGDWFPGKAHPYAFSEGLIAQRDTVEVRDRWETVIDTRFGRTPERTGADNP